MIYYKTAEEIELLRKSCMLVCETLSLVATMLRPGISGEAIDKKAEEYIRDNGAIPGFKDYNGFPSTLCISKNHQVVHGIPSKDEFKDGDVVSVDCGTYMNEFFGDAAYTFAIGDVNDDKMQLLSTTKKALQLGINQAKVGNRIGDIGFAVQQFCEKEHGYGVVRELVGHGVGKNLHESPNVPNFGRKGRGPLLKDGLVIAIEPMINLGRKDVRTDDDGWTIVTKDKMISAHYEHTIAVRKTGPDILSNHEIVENSIKNNVNLKQVS